VGGTLAVQLLGGGGDDTPGASGTGTPGRTTPEEQPGADREGGPEEGTEEESPGDEEPATREADADAPYYLSQNEVELAIRAPLFRDDHNLVLGDCFNANVTLIDIEELAVTPATFGDFDHQGQESGIQYLFCDDERATNDGIWFTPDLFAGSIDTPDPTAEQCYGAAHHAPLPNPIPPDDILRNHTLRENRGICVESPEGTLVLLWIHTVETNPNNRDLPTYLVSATQWKPNT
jgi:hypothetical protein